MHTGEHSPIRERDFSLSPKAPNHGDGKPGGSAPSLGYSFSLLLMGPGKQMVPLKLCDVDSCLPTPMSILSLFLSKKVLGFTQGGNVTVILLGRVKRSKVQ